MKDIERLDKTLYKAVYVLRDVCMYDDVWEIIRNNPLFLKQAVQVKKDKLDEAYTLEGTTIADTMLKQYKYVEREAYQ